MNYVCPACGLIGRPLSLVVDGHYRLIRCHTCGTEYFRPDPAFGAGADSDSLSEYWESYKFDVYGSPVVQAAFAARYNQMLDEARRYVSPLECVLDIGCGIGNFVAHAQSVGLRAVGSDLDPNAVRTARERGLTAYGGSELDEHLPPGSVDAVSMWDVIEHLFNPLTVLRGAVDKLRPGGALLIETPDAAFPVRPALLAAHRLTSGRINLTAPMYYWEHKIYFTERGLTALLDRVGVEVVSVRRATSLREKMEADFSETNDGTPIHRFLDAAWPTLETIFRGLGRGNKLLVVGRRSKT